jgi:ADP-ribose pyrophosphatase
MALISSRRVYAGRIIDLDLDTVAFPNGATGELEMIRHPGAAAVVPFLESPTAADPLVALIRQFRHAADRYVWEVPAGRLDPGETPEACARRELEEEAGLVADELRRLSTIYTTPGFTDEQIHLFLAHPVQPGAPRPEHDEFVEVHRLRWSAVLELICRGEIVDGKTLACLMFVQCCIRNPERSTLR